MKLYSFLKKALCAALAGALMFCLLTACGGNASSAPQESTPASTPAASPEEPPAAEPVTIRICWWGNQTRNDNTVKALEMYEAAHPDVKFEYEFSDWTGYWDKLATQAAGGNLPDIIQFAYTYMDQYLENNLLVSMSPYIENGTFDTTDIPQSALDIGCVDGQVYAICAGMQGKALLVNTDIMKEAGVTLSQQPTYEEFFEAAKIIYDKTGTQFVIPSNDEQSMLFLSRSHGYELFNEAGDGLGMPDGSIALEYFTMLKDTLENGSHVSPEIMAESSTNQESLFAAGKAWCEWTNSNMIINTINQCGEDIHYDILMYPTIENMVKQPLYMTPSMYWSITRDAQNADIAAEVINYLTNDVDVNTQALQGERGVPISNKVAQAIDPVVDDTTKLINAYVSEVAKVASPIDLIFPAASTEVAKLISDLADMVRYEEITPEEAAARFYTEANDILKRGAEG